MTAFGYVRKSVMADDSTTLSPALQRERIAHLASAHGDGDIAILEDLDVSGAKVEQRHGYMRLVEAIESGEATAVYAYDLSRLHRNTEEALRFFRIAREHGVTVRLVEGNIDTSGPTGDLVLTVLAAMNAWTSKVTSAKVKATFAMKRKRGDTDIGGRRYGEVRVNAKGETAGAGEDWEAVVAAYRDTGSTMRAARVLNAAGVPTRNGATRAWSGRAVESVVKYRAPQLMKDPADRGIRGSKGGARDVRFARLLRCSIDGALLTPMSDKGYVRYYCHYGPVTPHGRTTISESSVIDAVAAEALHAEVAVKRMKVGRAGDDAKLTAVEAERARVKAMFRKGRVDEAEFDAAMAELDAEEAKLATMKWIRRIALPPDVRADDAGKVNAYLRRLFERVTVDMETPGRRGKAVPASATFTWRNPSMRVDDIEAADEEAAG